MSRTGAHCRRASWSASPAACDRMITMPAGMTRRLPLGRCAAIAPARGFTLVEMMIALTLGMLVIAALAIVFNNAAQSRKEVERTARQVENGHYAMRVLTDDVTHAGYFAEFKPDVLATPVAVPDPCVTDIAS